MVLRALTAEDSGRLQCLVTTSADSVTSLAASLTVLRPTVILEASTPGLREVLEGTAVTLECRAATDPSVQDSLEVVWQVGGQVLRAGDPRLADLGPGHLDLRLAGGLEESGSYRCLATTSRDEARTPEVLVAVRRRTEVAGPGEEVLGLEGEPLVLECQVEVDPELRAGVTVSWSREGQLVHTSRLLELAAASLEDSGGYSCQAATRLDTAESGLTEVRVYPHSHLVSQPQPQMLLAGRPHSLQCRAEVALGLATRGLVWTWYREGVQVLEELEGGLVSALKLERGGSYRCSLATALETVSGVAALVQLLQPSLVLEAPRDTEVVEGGLVELRCRAEVRGWVEIGRAHVLNSSH